MADIEPIRAQWRRNEERFTLGRDPTDAELVAWAAACVKALIDLDTFEGAPQDPDELARRLHGQPSRLSILKWHPY